MLLDRGWGCPSFSGAFFPTGCPLVLQVMEEENFRAPREMLGEADGTASATHSA